MIRQWAWRGPRATLALIVNHDKSGVPRLEVPEGKALFGKAPSLEEDKRVVVLQPGELAAVVLP